jgi:hypothetical protein
MSEMQELSDIIKSVFNEDVKDITRRREIVDARIVFSKILRERGYTHSAIGRFLKKDHSTILSYMRNVQSLLTQVDGLMQKYKVCRDSFFANKEDLIVVKVQNEKEMSIISLNNQIEKLILERKSVLEMEQKYTRLSTILEMIDKRTPKGKEKLVLKNINLMFNDIANYGK